MFEIRRAQSACASKVGVPAFKVIDSSGKVIFDSTSAPAKSNLLNWPSPLAASAYALTDYPRFCMRCVVIEPAHIAPRLCALR